MEQKIGIKMPLIPLRGLTVFPNMVLSFPLGRDKSLKALEKAAENEQVIFLVAQRDPEVSAPTRKDLYEYGTIAKVKQVLKLPGNMTHVIAEGQNRGRILDFLGEENCDYAEVMEIEQDAPQQPSIEEQALMKITVEVFKKYRNVNQTQAISDMMLLVAEASKPGKMTDIIASGLEIQQEKKQMLLEMLNPNQRLETITQLLRMESDVLELKRELEGKVKRRMDKSQREYFLREQMKVIQEELGDKDGIGADAEAFRRRLKEKNPPQEVRDTVEREINRMLKIPVTSPESNVARTYIETILQLPWREETPEDFSMKKAEEILEKDHYGLEKVKERILEHLAVRKNAPAQTGSILCLVGPPGVGKTSIARSVAKALNRKYVRMSLGGVRDEAEIRGHRKTYIGAMPGRIINAMKLAGTNNPLLLLDEVDKLGTSHQGDPAAALLEVLDGEQNSTFRDHYIELPYDLSKVFFICTANSLDTIPQPLRDRMEIIQVQSYTALEKREIADNHLVIKQLKKHGLKKSQLRFSREALEMMIDGYTKEAGVRNLERLIGDVCRKTVKIILSGERKTVSITTKNLETYLGIKKYRSLLIFLEPQVGIVRGLAWTQYGGETLSIEVNTMKGKGKLELTGNLGDVMKESAYAAMSYIRSIGETLNLQHDFHEKQDIHIHIPEGAVPKDGPSAGITMATAMISALTGVAVRNDVAMTGEITIRGQVLPIGGLSEKVLAAKKAGIVTIILSEDNRKDLEEISEEIKENMEFVFATQMKTVLETALVEGAKIWK